MNDKKEEKNINNNSTNEEQSISNKIDKLQKEKQDKNKAFRTLLKIYFIMLVCLCLFIIFKGSNASGPFGDVRGLEVLAVFLYGSVFSLLAVLPFYGVWCFLYNRFIETDEPGLYSTIIMIILVAIFFLIFKINIF